MKKRLTVIAVLCLARVSAGQEFTQVSGPAGLSTAVATNGVAVADYDLDGDLDIYFVTRNQYDASDTTTWNKLFRNNGDGTFADVTSEAGVRSKVSGQPSSPMGYKFGAAWGDYDNDGDPDLYVSNYGPNQLFKNEGDGSFTEIAAAAGVRGNDTDICTSSAWWDYDGDGDLDLYVGVWGGATTDFLFTVNKMYENAGNDTFLDVTEETALGDTGRTWTSVFFDINGDHLEDLYVVNDFGPNRFYLNMGNRRFVDETDTYGLDDIGNGMGVTADDVNNDGLIDIYLTNISGLIPTTPNPLFTYTDGGMFVNRAKEVGVEIAGWGWGAELFDYDNDGDKDLYIVNGFVLEPGRNYFYKNMLKEARFAFINHSRQCNADGDAEGRGLVTFDYDADGDLDILTANFEVAPYLYRNNAAGGSWIKVRLKGVDCNRDALGARIEVVADGENYFRFNNGVDFLGQSLKPLHVGLGRAGSVDSISVTWPCGRHETFVDLPVRQTVTLVEGEGLITSVNSLATEGVKEFRLLGNYPNPFNGATSIAFKVRHSGEARLRIINVHGQEVYSARRRISEPGVVRMTWPGSDAQGRAVTSGVYAYTLRVGGEVVYGKLTYLK